jgi:phytoene dehydrogenase-like protein
MNDFDAIVIGSGFGGLTAAAVLARLGGRRVLVLERHFRAGGFTHTFARPGGYHWDVGVHYVGETETPLVRDVLEVATGGTVRWQRMADPFERLVFPGFRFDIRSGTERFREDLKGAFPGEARAIDRYLAAVPRAAAWPTWKALSGLLPGAVRPLAEALAGNRRALALQTTGQWLEANVRDARLKAVLGARWGDFGLPPGQGAFAMHAVIARHYLEGAAYPVGSAAVLARGAAAVIEAAGGAVRVRAEVERVLLAGGRAVGVRLKGGEELRAPLVVSDAGARATYLRLLPPEVPLPFRDQLAALPSSMAHATLYLGLARSPAELGLHGENFWLHDGLDHDALFAGRDDALAGTLRHAYLSFPSLKDPAARAHTAEVVVPLSAGPFARWAEGRWRNRGPEYDALKAGLTETLLAFVERHVPGLRGLVAFSELSTPLTTEHFAAHRGGEIYGLPSTPERYALPWLGARTPVPGLWLAGADALVPGLVGAMMGGFFAAAGSLGLRAFRDVSVEAARQRRAPPPTRLDSAPSSA